MPIARQLAIAAVLAGLTCAAASRLGEYREQPYDVRVLPPSHVVRAASLGHPTVAGNLYWLRAVQYMGEPRANERGWDRLHPLLDLVTDLDPGHDYAYQVGGVTLGSVGSLAESNALLEKGIRAVPSRYVLALLRGYNALAYEGDYALAGRYMEVAARAPGAPAHLTENVLAMYVKGDRIEAALTFLAQLHAEARDADTRAALEKQIRQALLERAAAPVDAAIGEYRSRHGVLPATVIQLVAEGLLAEVPTDPFGGSLVVGSDGRARSSANDFRFRPPEARTAAAGEPVVRQPAEGGGAHR